MRIVLRISFCLFAVSFLSGCISGFDRELAERRLDEVMPAGVAQQETVLRIPLKIAVFADIETLVPGGIFEEKWDWSRSDMELLMAYLRNLGEFGYISDYFIIPDNKEIKMHDIGRFTADAEKQGADVLLTVRGVIQTKSYPNPASLLNLTILGAWLVPGSNRDAMLVVHMDLWDVTGKSCVLSVKGDCVRKESGPTFLVDMQEAVDAVKAETLRKVFLEFKKRCGEIKPARRK